MIYDIPSSYDNGAYTLTAADFGSGGTVDWWAGQAYVYYLNTINYGGSNKWMLPTTPDTNLSLGSNHSNTQLGELYYNELHAKAFGGWDSYSWGDFGILDTGVFIDTSGSVGPFINAHTSVYWSDTEDSSYPSTAWGFDTSLGWQSNWFKGYQFYAWTVISPEQLIAAPLPGAVWLFGAGLLGLLGLQRRR